MKVLRWREARALGSPNGTSLSGRRHTGPLNRTPLFTVTRSSLARQRGTAGSWAPATPVGACSILKLRQRGHIVRDIVTESMKQPSSARHLDSQTGQSARGPRWLRHSALTIKTNFGGSHTPRVESNFYLHYWTRRKLGLPACCVCVLRRS